MKMPIDKEWFEKRAAAEGDLEVGAGGRRKTMTLYLTEEEIAELERLVNPNRDAIRAEAFEEAAKLAEDYTFPSRMNGPLVRNIQDKSQCPPCGLAASIRALAASPPPEQKKQMVGLEAVLNVIRQHRSTYDAERADLQRRGKANAHFYKALVDVCESIESSVLTVSTTGGSEP